LTNLFKGYQAASKKIFIKYIGRKLKKYEEGDPAHDGRYPHGASGQQVQAPEGPKQVERTIPAQGKDPCPGSLSKETHIAQPKDWSDLKERDKEGCETPENHTNCGAAFMVQ
jgi:hypothetical protein